MKTIAIICASISLIAGLAAAYYWYRASKVGISPSWTVEPGESDLSLMGWVSGNMAAFKKSGDLNKVAALWTGFSVVFGAISNFLMAFV